MFKNKRYFYPLLLFLCPLYSGMFGVDACVWNKYFLNRFPSASFQCLVPSTWSMSIMLYVGYTRRALKGASNNLTTVSYWFNFFNGFQDGNFYYGRIKVPLAFLRLILLQGLTFASHEVLFLPPFPTRNLFRIFSKDLSFPLRMRGILTMSNVK